MPSILWALTTALVLVGCSALDRMPDPTGPEVSEPRQATRQVATDLVESALELPGTQAADAIASSDACYEGSVNFKGRDPYTHQCALVTRSYVGSEADPTEFLPQLHQVLLSEGWQPSLSEDLLDLGSRYHPEISRGVCLTNAWYERDEAELTVTVSTAGNGGPTCWTPLYMPPSFWSDGDPNAAPTWEELGSPTTAVAIEIEQVYFTVERQ